MPTSQFVAHSCVCISLPLSMSCLIVVKAAYRVAMRGPFFIFLLCVLMVAIINGQYPQSSGAPARVQKFVDGIWTHDVYEEMKGARVRGGVHTKEIIDKEYEERKLANYRRGLKATTKIGSRPPLCKAKCKGCLPCTAVQVTVPPAQHNSRFTRGPFHTSSLSYHLESPYYSVAWKCRCKGKDYNP